MQRNVDSKIQYTDDFENLLKAEGEKAESMGILHMKSHTYFNNLSISINIPVIIVSSIVGFMSNLRMFENQAIFLGVMSIMVAILKTLDSYFDWTKRSEGHRIVGLNYTKISKFIQLQLSLEKECRLLACDLYDVVVNDLQNLKDQEPMIVRTIIKQFNKQYGHDTTVSKPVICNGLTNIVINKNSVKPPVSGVDVENTAALLV